jgi:hypothetical protein
MGVAARYSFLLRDIRAAIGHGMNFQTWRSLVREENLDDGEAVTLMVMMIRCIAQSSASDTASNCAA